jgi:hypothetical protein
MSLFQRKEKCSYADFGKGLADFIKESVLTKFESENSISSLFTRWNKQTLLKEWIIFNMFEMSQSVSAYFKGSIAGYSILDEFHNSCSKIFYEAGIFQSSSTFLELLRSRYLTYSEAFAVRGTGMNNNPLWVIAEKFCQFCNEDVAPFYEMAYVSEHFGRASIEYKKLIDNLFQAVRIVK